MTDDRPDPLIQSSVLAPRTPWQADFPAVTLHTDPVTRDRHPMYAAAKSGNHEAALTLAQELLSPVATERLRDQIVGDVILLPITALETTGFNAIPDAMAQVLAEELGLAVSAGEIVQINTVGHTRARAFNRMVTPAVFQGRVVRGGRYLLVDDHVGLGGTLANLKGHVETNGGTVVAMTTLTESRQARHIALRPMTLDVLRERYGDELEILWRARFGHGLDCLTDVEGSILGREPDVDAVRDRLAQAAVEVRRRGLEAAAEPDDR